MSGKNTLLAIRVGDRGNNAIKVQEVLTRHGCNIKVRLGLHDQDDGNVCSPFGTMILQLSCEKGDVRCVIEDLSEIEGVKTQIIDID